MTKKQKFLKKLFAMTTTATMLANVECAAILSIQTTAEAQVTERDGRLFAGEMDVTALRQIGGTRFDSFASLSDQTQSEFLKELVNRLASSQDLAILKNELKLDSSIELKSEKFEETAHKFYDFLLSNRGKLETSLSHLYSIYDELVQKDFTNQAQMTQAIYTFHLLSEWIFQIGESASIEHIHSLVQSVSAQKQTIQRLFNEMQEVAKKKLTKSVPNGWETPFLELLDQIGQLETRVQSISEKTTLEQLSIWEQETTNLSTSLPKIIQNWETQLQEWKNQRANYKISKHARMIQEFKELTKQVKENCEGLEALFGDSTLSVFIPEQQQFAKFQPWVEYAKFYQLNLDWSASDFSQVFLTLENKNWFKERLQILKDINFKNQLLTPLQSFIQQTKEKKAQLAELKRLTVEFKTAFQQLSDKKEALKELVDVSNEEALLNQLNGFISTEENEYAQLNEFDIWKNFLSKQTEQLNHDFIELNQKKQEKALLQQTSTEMIQLKTHFFNICEQVSKKAIDSIWITDLKNVRQQAIDFLNSIYY